MRIGAHLSIGRGHADALRRLHDIGGNCLQVFSASPRSWNMPSVLEEDAKKFREAKEKFDVDPVYFHSSFLVNLGDDSRVGHLSKKLLVEELRVAEQMGVKGSIIHIGSFKDRSEEPAFEHSKYNILLKNIAEVLDQMPTNALFIIENAGVRKIGKRIDEIAKIVSDLNDERVRVCLDTCHLHAVGIDISSEEKLDNFMDNFDKTIGLEKLELWHVNDSRDPLGSFRDRHENIGEGEIDLEVFKLIINHPRFKNLPFIIETPGFDKEGVDKKNINILKNLVTTENKK